MLHRHRARRREVIWIVPRSTRFAERHEQFSIRAELEDLVPGMHACLCCHFHTLRACCVGHPHIALTVHMEPVWPNEHPAAEAFDDLTFWVELEDRIDVLDLVVRAEAVDPKAAAGGHRHRAGLVASDDGPDAFTVNIDIDGSGRSRRPACPLTSRNERTASICQSLDGPVRIGQPGLREGP
jgi:hypothetical protein